MAQTLGMTEAALISEVKRLAGRGLIRRFGATVRHQDLGYVANAMVVWDVPDSQVDEAGRIMAGFSEVSHCYRRTRHSRWPFNLYTMVHGKTREECLHTVEKIARAAGLDKYRLLFSAAELKKSSMRYFV
jgi:DNA-binding Lrp family transcriptional regulator